MHLTSQAPHGVVKGKVVADAEHHCMHTDPKQSITEHKLRKAKDEINAPIALSAFRDGDQGPSKVTQTVSELRNQTKSYVYIYGVHLYSRSV